MLDADCMMLVTDRWMLDKYKKLIPFFIQDPETRIQNHVPTA
jgi:hypothetical protein